MEDTKRIEKAERTLWHLTVREVIRLSIHPDVTALMHDAIGEYIEACTIERHGSRDEILSVSNPFWTYAKNNPVYGPVPAPVSFALDEVPF